MNRRLVDHTPHWVGRARSIRTKDLTSSSFFHLACSRGTFLGIEDKQQPSTFEVQLSDLIAAGWLQPGISLFARNGKLSASNTVTLLPDGRLDLQGTIYDSPSAAAGSITGHPTNGWWFLVVERDPIRTLRGVRVNTSHLSPVKRTKETRRRKRESAHRTARLERTGGTKRPLVRTAVRTIGHMKSWKRLSSAVISRPLRGRQLPVQRA